jgi:hypothetical protein
MDEYNIDIKKYKEEKIKYLEWQKEQNKLNKIKKLEEELAKLK